MTRQESPKRLTLDEPAPLLRWLGEDPLGIDLGMVDPAEMWGLAALAALARLDGPAPLRVLTEARGGSAPFARAVGFDEAVAGHPPTQAAEVGRTVKLRRIQNLEPTERPSDQISKLLVPDPEQEDVRRTIYYVLNELLRNVVQHSKDPLGGIVGAQLHYGGRSASRPVVQVAVADAGIGIPASLQSRHTGLTDPQEALDKALWPHFSSAFNWGESGSSQNAGMGLFFIAEMTKLVGGRLVVASRGATLILRGDENFENPHGTTQFLERGVGFPGTLVAFEMPATEVQAYDSMIETIRERAQERTPRREIHKWLSFDPPPPEAKKFMVRHSRVEDTAAALAFGETVLTPLLVQRQPIALDFTGIPACTQSYVHALLFEPLRLAWARKTKIYILNAKPAVRSTLELLENYALGG